MNFEMFLILVYFQWVISFNIEKHMTVINCKLTSWPQNKLFCLSVYMSICPSCMSFLNFRDTFKQFANLSDMSYPYPDCRKRMISDRFPQYVSPNVQIFYAMFIEKLTNWLPYLLVSDIIWKSGRQNVCYPFDLENSQYETLTWWEARTHHQKFHQHARHWRKHRSEETI